MKRRNFLYSAAATAGLAIGGPLMAQTAASAKLARKARLGHKERVDRALSGLDVDRPPYTFYHHYKRPTAKLEAQDHLEFHRAYDTDIVKVMNDFDYPRSTTGKWHELKTFDSPYPDQLETLRIVRDGLNGDADFIDTIYGPYMTAMLMFMDQPQFAGMARSEEGRDKQSAALRQFQQAEPGAWHGAMEAITQSTLNHIGHIKQIGAAGALVSIFNAESKFGSTADYEIYSRPYDKRIFDALADTRLTVLHLHFLERPYIDQFKDFAAPVVQYSVRTSGIPISEIRRHFAQPILGGVDEIDYTTLSSDDMRGQWQTARAQAGAKYVAAPGCSVPNESTPEQLARFPASFES